MPTPRRVRVRRSIDVSRGRDRTAGSGGRNHWDWAFRADWTAAVAQAKRHVDEFPVDEPLVRRLLRAQFPQWADLPLRPIEPSGTDHTLFRLGNDLVVRVPIVERVTEQSQREAKWVPFLAPQLPLEL